MLIWKWKKLALFAGGALFGSAGLKILASQDAKKVYTHITAAVLRGKESIMTSVNQAQECAGDILADAKTINEERAKSEAAEIIEDSSEVNTSND